MGKKILIGCLAFLVIGVIAGSIGLYVFVYQPAKEYVQSLSELGEMSKLNDSIENQASYSVPADGILTQEQVERFVRVQRSIVNQLGSGFDALKQKYEPVSSGEPSDIRLGLWDLLGLWKDLRDILQQAKKAQVEALNVQGFSEEEYNWVRKTFYKSVGANLGSIDLSRIQEAIDKKDPEILMQPQDTSAPPDQNRELVEPYKKEAGQWLAYAWFGL